MVSNFPILIISPSDSGLPINKLSLYFCFTNKINALFSPKINNSGIFNRYIHIQNTPSYLLLKIIPNTTSILLKF